MPAAQGPKLTLIPGDTLFAQAPGQPVEECVGRAVGALPIARPTPRRSTRWTGRSPVQISAGFAQIPSTPDLPGEHPIYLGVVQGTQRRRAVLAGGVHDAGQWRKLGLHGGHQASDVVRIADIGRDHPDLGSRAARASASMRRCAASTGCPPAGQHQLPGAVRGQVSGDLQSERTQSAGHQIRCIRTQFQRCRVAVVRYVESGGGRAPRASRSAIWSSPRGAASTWLISCDQSSAPPRARSASPPHACGYSSAAARQNPHRPLCSGDTVSAPVTRCAPWVITQMGHAVRRRPRRGTVAECRRGRGVASAAATASTARRRSPAPRVQDAQRRFVFHRGAQLGRQAFLVGVRQRQSEDAVPVTVSWSARRSMAA